MFVLLCLTCSNREKDKKEFLWGASFSGFQADMGGGDEYNYKNSDWWVWLHDEQNIRNKIVSGDLPEQSAGFLKYYEQDLSRAKALKLNAFRYGPEWSRVFPESTTKIPVKVERDENGLIKHIEITEETINELDKIADKTAVELYRKIYLKMRELGLEPFVVVHHFVLPLFVHNPLSCRDWYSDSDRTKKPVCYGEPSGWLSETAIVEYVKYVAYIASKLGDLVDMWATLNEPMVISSMGYLVSKISIISSFPPNGLSFDDFASVSKNLVVAHSRAYDVIKKFDKSDANKDGVDSWVGIVHATPYFDPFSQEEIDLKAVEKAKYVNNFWFIDAVAKGEFDEDLGGDSQPISVDHLKRLDFVGINYYTRLKVKYIPLEKKYGFEFLPDYPPCPTSTPTDKCPYGSNDFGWEIYPPGIQNVILEMWNRYKIPIIVSENGTSDADDDHRPWYLVSHIYEVFEARKKGADVRGYFHWAFMDNLEWSAGFGQKFGLFEVDFSDPAKPRKARKSAEIYKEIAENNGISEKLLGVYLKSVQK